MDLWHFLSLRSATTITMGSALALSGHNADDDLAGEVETSVRLNDALARAPLPLPAFFASTLGGKSERPPIWSPRTWRRPG